MTTFDYIIIGAGSAGCVLANKLGADTSKSILVLEAGPMDRDLFIHLPAGVYRAWRNPKINWNYDTDAEPSLDNREVFMPRGRVVGGSSSINSMVYMRGHPLDYDNWADEFGLSDWTYAQCLPYFKAGETYFKGSNDYRGDNGPLGVHPGDYENPLFDAFVDAGEQAGQGRTDDPNGFNPEGLCRLDATKKNGRRCSAAVAHLRPAMKRGNVTLICNAQVSRIEMGGNRATGVTFMHKGENRTIEAGGEIILSGGAINSPKLLMLSGIGPAEHLKSHDIAVQQHVQGVGQNLQDHANIIMQFESLKGFPIHRVDRPWNKALAGARWVFTRDGVAASNIWEAGGTIRSDESVTYPNLQYHFGPVGFEYDGDKIVLNQAFAIHMDVSRPRSRGEITLASADPLARPNMQFNYLSHPEDMAEMVTAARKIRELVAQPAFDGLRGAELPDSADATTDDDLRAWIRATMETDFHPSCSCRMGHDDNAVVDDQFRVHGVEGLRVVDASVMPKITCANLNAPVQMIAARAADYIAGNPQLPAQHVKFAFES